MGLKNIFREQLSKVIEWRDQDTNQLWYKFPSRLDEIKNASKLIVAPGQGCVLVYEGQVRDVLEEEGLYVLDSDNHPFITTLLRLRQGFESEHKFKIYFYRRAMVPNQPWGTPTPLKFVDPVYSVPVELGVHGNFSYSISDVRLLFAEILGSVDEYGTEQLRQIITDRIIQQIGSHLAQQRYSYVQIDAELNSISGVLKSLLTEQFLPLGVNLTDFRITGSIFDDKTRERIDEIADIKASVQAAEQAGLSYVELEKLRALRDAARNEGGLAGAGLQMGVGLELGRRFLDTKEDVLDRLDKDSDTAVKLRKLKLLLDEEIISPADYDAKKKEILDSL